MNWPSAEQRYVLKSILIVIVLSLSKIASATSTAQSRSHDNVASPSADINAPNADGIYRYVRETRNWLDDQECTHARYSEDENKRDPNDLLNHFGSGLRESDVISTAVRVLDNITNTYGKRFLSTLPHRVRRGICAGAGFHFTVKDCPLASKLYRTHVGTCNNLFNLNWGQAFTPFVRMLPPVYADDLGNPRLAKSGVPLPGARSVSTAVFDNNNVDVAHEPWTALSMHLGQFLDHDVDHSAVEDVKCTCGTTSSKCLPIPVPDGDPFLKTPCIKFTRSVSVPDENCNVVPRQQLNQITSFIDLSMVYSSSTETAMHLRDVKKGKGLLLSLNDPHNDVGRELLPNDNEHKDCIIASPELKCGRTGDARAAEQPGLTSIHTLLLRQHNNIARYLWNINPTWDDETLYQEARKINIAMWQHIVYNEYLPPLMGKHYMTKYRLQVHPETKYEYSCSINPSIVNVFATVAFRVGHSQIPSTLLKLDRDYKLLDEVSLAETYFNATHMVSTEGMGGAGAFLRGMVVQRLPRVDTHFTDDITRHLFASQPGGEGLDLAALNIQRGRDHGMAPYGDWREKCGLPRPRSFDDLPMSKDSIERLRKVYGHVDDIDFFPASIAEEIESGSLIGPTLICLLGEQFHNLKFGDRFWYENRLGDQAFSEGQLQEIRKATMARLICDNSNDMKTIQPYVFRIHDTGTPPPGSIPSFYDYSKETSFPEDNGDMPGFFNGRVPCNDGNIPAPNLHLWKAKFSTVE